MSEWVGVWVDGTFHESASTLISHKSKYIVGGEKERDNSLIFN